ncbi:MAG TPA: hypothetical protein VG433_16910 [Pirellulales bacterium]|jgi:hypothetical protein|nr:hypothetical protein [Pirellulales bacterium]
MNTKPTREPVFDRRAKIVTLPSNIHAAGDATFGGSRLTACGRSIAAEAQVRDGIVGHMTCVECMVAHGVPRKLAAEFLLKGPVAIEQWNEGTRA